MHETFSAGAQTEEKCKRGS